MVGLLGVEIFKISFIIILSYLFIYNFICFIFLSKRSRRRLVLFEGAPVLWEYDFTSTGRRNFGRQQIIVTNKIIHYSFYSLFFPIRFRKDITLVENVKYKRAARITFGNNVLYRVLIDGKKIILPESEMDVFIKRMHKINPNVSIVGKRDSRKYPLSLVMSLYHYGAVPILGLILSVKSLLKILHNKEEYKGLAFSILAIILSSLPTILVLFLVLKGIGLI
jgi:hypothetical protein